MGPPVLSARPGDCQALKACIAAESSGVKLSLAVADPKNAFGTPSVQLTTPQGGTISEPNAVAAFLAGAAARRRAAADRRLRSRASATQRVRLLHRRARCAALLAPTLLYCLAWGQEHHQPHAVAPAACR